MKTPVGNLVEVPNTPDSTSPAAAHFDVVVVGRGLTARLGAAALSQSGYKVLHVGCAGPGLTYQLGPWRLPTTPPPAWHMQDPHTVSLLTLLGAHRLVRRGRQRPPGVCPQAITKDHRFVLHPDPRACITEMEREFPADKRLLLDHLKQAHEHGHLMEELTQGTSAWPPEGLWQRYGLQRKARRARWTAEGTVNTCLGELPADHQYRVAIAALGEVHSVHGGNRSDLENLWGVHRLKDLATPLSLQDAIELEQWLDEVIGHHGGLHRRTENLTSLHVDRRRITGVTLARSRQTHRCNFLLSTLPASELAPLMTDPSAMDSFFDRAGEPAATVRLYTVNLVVKRCAVPTGMERWAVFADLDNSPMRVHWEPLDDEHCVVCSQIRLPHHVATRPEVQRTLREQIMRRLRTVAPFLDDHLLAVDSPHDTLPPLAVKPCVYTQLDTREPRGPEHMPVLYRFPDKRDFCTAAMPYDTPVKGLHLFGTQTIPALGDHGELLSLMTVLQHLIAQDPQRQSTRRGRWGPTL